MDIKNLQRIRSRWRRLVFKALLFCLMVFDKNKSRRSRVHWAGNQFRPRRLERALGLFVICGALIFLEPREYVIWGSCWGGMASAFVIWHSLYRVVPRKLKFHWVK